MTMFKKTLRVIWRYLDLACGTVLLIYGMSGVLSRIPESCLADGTDCWTNYVDELIPWVLICSGCVTVLGWWFFNIFRRESRELKSGIKPENFIK